MKVMPENPNRGSSFEDFLKEEGILEASTTTAVKRVLAWQIEQAMRTQHITKSAMAARMHTSRSQLERLLDPEKTGVSLETIQRAAAVVGRELRVELV
jgi:antitoxin HicB